MNEMSQPITKGELKAEMAAFEQRADRRFEQIDQRFEQIDQRFEQLEHNFDRKLEIWGGALNAKIETVSADVATLSAKIEAQDAKIEALRSDMTRGFNVVIETLRADMRTIWEPVKDVPERVRSLEVLPERVSRLEEAVFGPKPKRRARRRAG